MIGFISGRLENMAGENCCCLSTLSQSGVFFYAYLLTLKGGPSDLGTKILQKY